MADPHSKKRKLEEASNDFEASDSDDVKDDKLQRDIDIRSIGSIESDDDELSEIDETEFEEEWDPEHDRYNAEDYNVEPDPPCAAYQDAYRQSDRKATECLLEFPNITSAAQTDPRLRGILKHLEETRAFIEAEPIRIAFLGEAGKGQVPPTNTSRVRKLIHKREKLNAELIGRQYGPHGDCKCP